MSAWTKFATQFFHNKQKQNPDYKFSQALKEASKVYKKTKGGSSKKQRGGIKYEINDGKKVECVDTFIDNGIPNPNCKDENEIDKELEGKSVVVPPIEGVPPVPVPPVEGVPLVKAEGEEGEEVAPVEGVPLVKEEEEEEKEELGGKKGGRKSQKKAKKAGKKSQKKSKKAKKAGSKKSKK